MGGYWVVSEICVESGSAGVNRGKGGDRVEFLILAFVLLQIAAGALDACFPTPHSPGRTPPMPRRLSVAELREAEKWMVRDR